LVQAESFKELMAYIPEGLSPKTIADIGCGTGARTQELAGFFQDSKIIGIDPSEEKIGSARQKYPSIRFFNTTLLDFENSDTYDLIVSNASVQWMQPLEDNLKKLVQMLNKDGYFVATVFGPDTFKELQTVLACLEKTADLPTATFPTSEMLRKNITAITDSFELKKIIMRNKFDSLKALLKSIRMTQTSGKHGQGLWTPRFLEKAETLYRDLYGGIYATYDVTALCAKKTK